MHKHSNPHINVSNKEKMFSCYRSSQRYRQFPCNKCSSICFNKRHFEPHFEAIFCGHKRGNVASPAYKQKQPHPSWPASDLPSRGQSCTTDDAREAVCQSAILAAVQTAAMDHGNCSQWLQAPISEAPPDFQRHNHVKSATSLCLSTKRGNSLPVEKRSYKNCSPKRGTQRVLQPLFRGTKEGRRSPSHFGFTHIKQAPEGFQIQNVNPPSSDAIGPARRLVQHCGLKRRLFSHSDFAETQTISALRFREHGLRISGFTLRPVSRTPCVYQMSRGCVNATQRAGNPNLGLPGRFAAADGLSQSGRNPPVSSNHSFAVSRFYYKPGKELFDSQSENPLSGPETGLSIQPGFFNATENRQLQPLPLSVPTKPAYPPKTVSTPAGSHVLHDTSYPARSLNDEEISKVDIRQERIFTSEKECSGEDHTFLPACFAPLERSSYPPAGSTAGSGSFPCSGYDRRLQLGLGRSVPGQAYKRRMVGQGEILAHQSVRAVCSVSVLATFPPHGSAHREACSGAQRQRVRNCAHKQTGRDALCPSSCPVTQPADLGQCPFVVAQSNTYSGSAEQRGRSPLQRISSSEGVEAASGGGGTDMGPVRQSLRRSVRLQGKRSLPSFLLATGRERASRAGRTGSSMATDAAVCVSPRGADSGHVGARATEQAIHDPDCPPLAREGLVCGDHITPAREAVALTEAQESADTGTGSNMASSTRTLEPVGLAPEREKLAAAGLPSNVIATIQSARAASTQGLYTHKWRAFEAWCGERGVVPFESSVVNILTFLQELLEKGLSFSTIKVYLSAISACHVGFGKLSPGAHPLVVRFMKGVLRMRPGRRITVPQWDLTLVLDALCDVPFEPLDSVGLDMLSYKTAFLLAACSAKRMGDIHALSVHPSCICFAMDGSKVSLHPNPAYIPKVVASYKTLPFELSSYSPPPFASQEDRRLHALCPVRALRIYINRTRDVRLTDQLFVCFANPVRGRALSKQRLSHWVVEAISRAYSSKGKELPGRVQAHSTRSVAASWALFKGVSVEDVCSAASWASPHTFLKFYRLDVTAQDVTQAVLSAGRKGP